ncbi:hypothetical protein [Chroococcus sp. FPU101]|uniref:hypothetical protein n=1 Tax=Chroococcus sp. FPU101 TaxID=1974212 RepID=UPI001A8E07D7|nr:hypothetical protein [Chroococcus sp. FPU101]GFE68105.1 hypothetical protein CFPU101_07150 [Chroococcus sp. FPU101]
MLSQIVRPLVQTQIRLLANSQATYPVLIETICRWLGYLGVQAKVTHLAPTSDQIQISLSVGKPDSCDQADWQKILTQLAQNTCTQSQPSDEFKKKISLEEQILVSRLLAYLIQVGNPENILEWETLKEQLTPLNLDETLTQGLKSALKVPQSSESLMKKLNPDLAAIALPMAVKIAMLDQQINSEENTTLQALLKALNPAV